MLLAVASGKGGTGKTTVAVNLARVINTNVQLFDCDVEEPNDHLFLKGEIEERKTVTVPIPSIDESRCRGCGTCSEFCAFEAIVLIGRTPMVFPELCHSCGGCMNVCPRSAISEIDKRIGVIEVIRAGAVKLIQGRLDVGMAMAPPLIRAVRARTESRAPAILDAPPGASCPMVTTIRGADFVLLVAEPTPFGLHDLKLAVRIVRKLGGAFGVVVNRVGIGDGRVHEFCRSENIPILLEIPDDRRIAEACARGRLLVDALPEYQDRFRHLAEILLTSAPPVSHLSDRLGTNRASRVFS